MGVKSSILNLALFLIVFRTNINPNEVKKFGILEYYLASSSATFLSDVKGLSNTMAAIEGSRSACIKAVIAPILLPHNPGLI